MHNARIRIALLVALLAALVGLGGCGLPLDWTGDWDATCYDCRTVCDGTVDDVRDDCLASCHACQGFSACFFTLQDQFQGMSNPAESDWQQVDCEGVE